MSVDPITGIQFDSGARHFFDPAGQARERAIVFSNMCHRMIDDMVSAGVFPASAPWADERFQVMIVARLHKTKRLEDDARKFAALKEIFGGAK